MYYVVTIATLVTMALALIRALMGPSIYDRVLAANMFGTKTVLLLSVIAFLYGRPDFLDLAGPSFSSADLVLCACPTCIPEFTPRA